ncbi:SxtJ family membrane protein [Microcoleus sp. MOSTC5]|uniref:SxtJ family membrane protein n=1 Tax=Microcoleus sp. MOSTC5 TaxID=3055378 RepID=UPI002FD3E163
MSDEIKKLDKKGLRDFGLLIGGLIAVLFGLIPLLRRHSIPWLPFWLPWAIGAVLIVLALVAPKSLNPIYHGWMRFGLILHKIQTPIVLGIVFYLIIWPMGVIKNIFGEDAMRRKLNPKMDTYRIPSKARTKVSMERPF